MKVLDRLTAACLLLLLLGSSTLAQTNEQPLVVFIVGRALDTSSSNNTTEVGLSKLADMFILQGARVQIIEPEQPIPEEARVAVLIRPLRRLTFVQIVRLWVHLQRGNNLLLAVDPDNYYLGYANANTQIGRTGFDALLLKDYGISLGDGFLVDPWFTQESITSIDNVASIAQVDALPNPITEPLVRYEVPVWYWGARNIQVEPFGLDSFAVPLLYTDRAYGETNPDVFAGARGNRIEAPEAPLELNLDEDLQGRLLIGGFAESTRTGSRLVVVGDSEIFLNGFGLSGPAQFPQYPGNQVFAQRLVGWLMDYPVSVWGALPEGYTWLAIDGNARDWQDLNTASYTRSGAVQAVRAFNDDLYVYLLLETSAEPDASVTLTVGDNTIQASAGRVLLNDEILVPDAKMAVGDVIELRLPLRLLPPPDLVSQQLTIQQICLETCLDEAINPLSRILRAPYDYALTDHLIVQVRSAELDTLNMRVRPSEEAEVIATVPNGTILAALGRDAAGEWIKVENALYSGWMAAFLFVPNGDLLFLPVLEG